MARIGIESGHVRGPKSLSEITSIGDEGVGKACEDWKAALVVHCAEVFLLDNGDYGDDEGEEQKTDFFAKKGKQSF